MYKTTVTIRFPEPQASLAGDTSIIITWYVSADSQDLAMARALKVWDVHRFPALKSTNGFWQARQRY